MQDSYGVYFVDVLFFHVQSLSAPVGRIFRTILLSSQKSGRLSLQLNKNIWKHIEGFFSSLFYLYGTVFLHTEKDMSISYSVDSNV